MIGATLNWGVSAIYGGYNEAPVVNCRCVAGRHVTRRYVSRWCSAVVTSILSGPTRCIWTALVHGLHCIGRLRRRRPSQESVICEPARQPGYLSVCPLIRKLPAPPCSSCVLTLKPSFWRSQKAIIAPSELSCHSL